MMTMLTTTMLMMASSMITMMATGKWHFDQAIKQNLDDEIRNVFKLFMQSGDSSFLVSHVMSASEEMMHSFCETNFSNNEIGALAKLRRLRSAQYRDAF